MAASGLTITWDTRVIFVSKSYLTPTTNPTTFNLDTNQFRLDLKALENSVEGMSYPDTHTHNTEVPLGGVIYARIIEIINGYTVTFENDFYAVNLFGSNNNIGDVVNLNFVSVRTNNAAGLIVDPGISKSLDYGEHIIYNANNIDGTGSEWPVGTYANPVNNITDLQLLLTKYGRTEVLCLSDITLTQDFYDISFLSKTGDEYFYPNGFKVHDCNITKMTIDGDFNHSRIFASECSFYDVQNIGGTIYTSGFFGDVLQTPQYQLVLYKCASIKLGIIPVNIDMVQGIDTIFATRGHSGPLSISNCDTSASTATIIFEAGNVSLDNSCSDGLIVLGGTSSIQDNSTSGCTVDITGVINPDTIVNSAYFGAVSVKENSGYSGISFPNGTTGRPVDNITDAITIASERGVETIHVHGNWEFKNGDFLNDFTIEGDSKQHSMLTFNVGSILLNCVIKKAKVIGEISGIVGFEDCHLFNIGSVNPTPSTQDIIISNSLIDGTNYLPPAYSGIINVLNCWSGIPGNQTPTFDLGFSNASILIRDYIGGIKLTNFSGNTDNSIDMSSGNVIFDSTLSGGTFVLRGISKYTDNSSSGCTIDVTGLLDPENLVVSGGTGVSCNTQDIANAVWDELTADNNSNGTFGALLQDLILKASESQHTLNVQTEMLKNKPNNC